MSDIKPIDFDENKASEAMDAMSRVIAAIGVDTMKNLVTLRVLVLGLRGVGVETAKNLILGRPAAVIVWDPNPVTIQDLGTNFYVNEQHVASKVTLAEACVPRLAELNPYVQVSAYAGALDESFLSTFGAVIVTRDFSKTELIRLNDICHNHKIAFILAQTHGVTGVFFTDFGPEHLVTDRDGEPKRTVVIEKIDHISGRVKTVKDHGFDDGDYVQFSEILGLDEAALLEHAKDDVKPQFKYLLNKVSQVRVKRVYQTSSYTHPKTGKKGTRTTQIFNQFQLDLESLNEELKNASLSTLSSLADLGEYGNGGIVTEVKAKRLLKFRPLRTSLINPCVDEEDVKMGVFHPDQERWLPESFGGKGYGSQLHIAYLAFLEFLDAHGQAPQLHHEEDAKKMLALAQGIVQQHNAMPDGEALKIETLNEKIVLQYALYARSELPGYTAFLGGVAAQEVLKKFGKYTPHYQWMHVDHLELLNDNGGVPADAAVIGSRYDYPISIFGKSVQDKIMNQKWFLIGCGALGCEYLKGFALMGLGAGDNGLIHITDMDRIELSNLSRQFLFRNHHIGKPKSVCGALVAQEMNPHLKLKTYETKVSSETENIFTDSFWNSLTGAWNALDNVHARRYTDAQCLLYTKPLLESGTMGTSANSEIIIPHMTSSYNDHKDQDVAGIAACTLRNFPHLIEHCIEWARPEFQELFELGPQNVNKFISDPEGFFRQVSKEGNSVQQLETLQRVKTLLDKTADRSFDNCVALALDHFARQFRSRILDLIHFFPKDTRVVDKETKADLGPFWTGSKRFPRAVDLNLDDELHLQHLFNTANLYAYMFNLEQERDVEKFKAKVRALNLSAPVWKAPAKGPNMEGEDVATNTSQEEKADVKDDDTLLEELTQELRGMNAEVLKSKLLRVSEFEKDDDTNFHIDFVTSTSNLRAWNYHIQPTTRHKCKVIAGRIIPALATTTAMITGLVELEYYKFVLGRPLNQFFNSNPNLAIAKYSFFNPSPPAKVNTKNVVDEETKETTVVKAYPEGFSSWDHVVVQKGNLTGKEFADLFPSLHHGLTVNLLFKAGITAEDVAKGTVQALYNNAPPRSAAFAEQQLKRENLSEAIRAQFQKQVDAVREANAKQEQRNNSKLLDLYLQQHGALPSEERDFLLLQGDFRDADGNVAETPLIKFYFK